MMKDLIDMYRHSESRKGGMDNMDCVKMNIRGKMRFAMAFLLIAMLFVSCQLNVAEPPAGDTQVSAFIAGKATVPSESGISPGGISISVISDGNPVTTLETSSDGSFMIKGLTSDSRYTLIFSTENAAAVSRAPKASNGFGGWLSNIVPSTTEGASIGNIKMKPLGRIEGKVSLKTADSNGNITMISIPGTSYMATADDEGFFSMANVPQGIHQLRITHVGYTPVNLEGITLANNSYSEHPVVTVPDVVLTNSRGSVSGQVRLPGTADYKLVEVTLSGPGATNAHRDTTDEDGRYMISDVLPGTYDITFSHSKYMSLTLHGIEVKQDMDTPVPEQFLKRIAGSVSGRIVLEGAASSKDIRVLLKSADNLEQLPEVLTSDDGSFTVYDVNPGSYDLIAFKDNYETLYVKGIDVLSGEHKAFDTEHTMNRATQSVIGNVTLEGKNDAEYEGVQISATDMDDPTAIYIAITNSKGQYALMNLPAGRYMVTASRPGYSTSLLDNIEFTGNGVLTLSSIRLDLTKGIVSGVVDLPGRTDKSGARVRINDTEYETVTDRDGVFSFSIPTGNYSYGLTITHDYHTTYEYKETITVLENGSFVIPSIQMEAEYADVKGTIKIINAMNQAGTDVAIAGITAITDSDGVFICEKVPLGKQVLRITNSIIPDTERDIVVKPGNVYEIGDTISIEPQMSTIYGQVKLQGLSDHAGIKVTVISEGKAIAMGNTDSLGIFRLSDIPKGRMLSVVFSRDGWEEHRISSIPALAPLEERDITENESIELLDKTSPVITGLYTGYGMEASSSKVEFSYSVTEEGSGLAGARWSWNKPIAQETEYVPITEGKFTSDIADMKNNAINEFYFQVKDKAGNESEIRRVEVSLKIDHSELANPMEGEKLHLVKERSPYHINSWIEIPEGKTLVIDPGVKVVMRDGAGITVKGSIQARGTESEQITFEREGNVDGSGYMIDISAGEDLVYNKRLGEFQSGSMFEYCNFSNYGLGIYGKFYMNHSYMAEGDVAIGKASGNLYDMLIVNSIFKGKAYIGDSYRKTSICAAYGNEFYSSEVGIDNADFINNKVTGGAVSIYTENSNTMMVGYNTFDGCSMDIRCNTSLNEFRNISTPIKLDGDISYSNFIGNTEPVIEKHYYAGEAWTVELSGNYFDSSDPLLGMEDSDRAKVDIIDERSVPLDEARYSSSRLFMNIAVNGEFKVGDPVIASFESASDEITEYAYSTDPDLLKAEPQWIPYKGYIAFEDIPESLSEDGLATVHVLGRNGQNLTNVEVVEFTYQRPVIKAFELRTDFSRDQRIVERYEAVTNYPGKLEYRWYVDGELYEDSLVIGLFSNGEHTLKMVVSDLVGNETESEVKTFIVDNPCYTARPAFYQIHRGMPLDIRGDKNKGATFVDVYENFAVSDRFVGRYDLGGSENYEFSIPAGSFNTGNGEIVLKFGKVENNEDVFMGTCSIGSFTVDETTGTLEIEYEKNVKPNASFKVYISNRNGKGIKSYKIFIDDVLYKEFSREAFNNQRVYQTNVVIDPYHYTVGPHTVRTEAESFDYARAEESMEFNVVEKVPVVLNFMGPSHDEVYYQWNYDIQGKEAVAAGWLLMDGIPVMQFDSYFRDFIFKKNEMILPAGNHKMQMAIRLKNGTMMYSSEVYDDQIPGEITGYWGETKSWYSDGRLLDDYGTGSLFSFTDGKQIMLDSGTRKLYPFDIQPEWVADGPVGGCITNWDCGYLPIDGSSLGSWTVEFLSKIAEGDSISLDFYPKFKMDITGIENDNLAISITDRNGKALLNDYRTTGFLFDDNAKWRHFALTCDGNAMKLYINGIEICTKDITQSNMENSASMRMYISNGCLLDELRISSRLRTNEELFAYASHIQAIMREGVKR